MRGAQQLHRRPALRIDVGAPLEQPPPRRVLLMAALDDGPHRPRRLAIGSGEGAALLSEVLDGRRRDRTEREAELFTLGQSGDELVERLREQSPDEVYFVLDGDVDERLVEKVGPRLLMDGVALHMVLPKGLPPVRTTVGSVGGRTCVSLHAVQDGARLRVVSRAIDVLGAAVLLALLSPLFLVVGALVWWRMGWPVVYAQSRMGQFARRFSLYKFRSMVPNADEVLHASPEVYRRYVASNYKLPEGEDPRITPLGRLLRRTSLDELPQLWNVLRGDMALVGPRPVVPEELSEYGDYAHMLLRLKPGLTGAWQVGGRSTVKYPERARIDLSYVGGRSLSDDLLILVRTLPAVLRRRGAI